MPAPTTSIRLSSTTPAAPSGNQNVVPQSDGGTPQAAISFYPQPATNSLLGVVRPDGSTITVDDEGVISAVGGGGGGGSGSAVLYVDSTEIAPLGGPELQINGTDTASQSKLNLVAGSNVTLSADGSGDVTVAASGGGGGGLFGPVISIPTLSSLGMSTAFQQQGTFSASDIATGVLLQDTQAFGNADQVEGICMTYPGSAFTFTALIVTGGAAYTGTNALAAGIFVAAGNDGTSRIIMCSIGGNSAAGAANTQVGNTKFNDATSFDSWNGASQMLFHGCPLWLRYQDDGTNYTCSWSPNGVTFLPLYSEVKSSSWLGSGGFNFLGLYIDPHNTTDATLTVLSSSLTTP